MPPREDGRASYIDYEATRAELKAWEARDHVDLLETLAEDALAIGFLNPLVVCCRALVEKPDIFDDVDGVGVEVFRWRGA